MLWLEGQPVHCIFGAFYKGILGRLGQSLLDNQVQKCKCTEYSAVTAALCIVNFKL